MSTETRPFPDWPDGYGRQVLEVVDSTLTEAARLAPGLSGPEWILARRQTGGRGRRGRPWRDPVGNFAATLVLFPAEPPGTAALRSFVAALAVLRACEELAPANTHFALKWPNDVLMNGGKVAGILLESVGLGGRISHLSIGIGVNLARAPHVDEVETGAVRPVALAGAGEAVDPEVFLSHLAAAYATLEAEFQSHGFAPIRTAWLARAARLGERINARTDRREVSGTFHTVDETGNLVLLTTEGPAAIPAADIFF